jgi:hypothetical protein
MILLTVIFMAFFFLLSSEQVKGKYHENE